MVAEPKKEGWFSMEKENKYYCKITLSGLPTGGNARQHWTTKYTEVTKWKKRILAAVGSSAPAKPLERVKLKFTRASCGSMDWDNMIISFKSIQDGLVEARILADDKITNIPEIPMYEQANAKRGDGYVVIEVWEL